MKKLLSLAMIIAFVLALAGCAQTSKTWSVSFDLQSKSDKSYLSEEDIAVIEKLLTSDGWVDGLCDCASDVSLDCNDGRSLRYSSDCGRINDISRKRCLELDDNEKKSFNELLQKYGELGFDIQSND